MTAATGRTLTLVLGTGPQDGATVAALRLAEAAVQRGHRVTIYAYGDGARVAAEDSATGGNVAGLLRAGLHGGLVSWVVDADAARGGSVAGVMTGDPGDLWRFVRDADVSLGVPR